jgi:hypothetical protein
MGSYGSDAQQKYNRTDKCNIKISKSYIKKVKKFFFSGIGASTQGFHLEPLHPPDFFFVIGLLAIGSHYLPGLASNPISF